MTVTKDALGCIAVVAALGIGAHWLYGKYKIVEREPPRFVVKRLPSNTPHRRRGMISLATAEQGARWALDADSVRGNRDSRMGWVLVDYSSDKRVSYRTSKTLYSVNCDTLGYRNPSVVLYSATGKVISSSDSPDSKQTFSPPGTFGDAVVTEMCKSEFDGAHATPAK